MLIELRRTQPEDGITTVEFEFDGVPGGTLKVPWPVWMVWSKVMVAGTKDYPVPVEVKITGTTPGTPPTETRVEIKSKPEVKRVVAQTSKPVPSEAELADEVVGSPPLATPAK